MNLTPFQILLAILFFIIILVGLWYIFSIPYTENLNLIYSFDGLSAQEVVNKIIDIDHNNQLKKFKQTADYFILGTISENGYPNNRYMRAFFNDGRNNFTFITPKNSGKVDELNLNNKASAFFSFKLNPVNYTDISFFGQPTIIEDKGTELVYAFNPQSVAVYHRKISIDGNAISTTYQFENNKMIKTAEYITFNVNNTIPIHPFDK